MNYGALAFPRRGGNSLEFACKTGTSREFREETVVGAQQRLVSLSLSKLLAYFSGSGRRNHGGDYVTVNERKRERMEGAGVGD